MTQKSVVAQSLKDEKEGEKIFEGEVPPMFPAVVPGSPADMILSAVSKGTDLNQLEKLLEVQLKWEANEAKKAYHRAMTAFKADPPDIEKDKKVSFGQTKYNHATLANVTEKINSALSKHGLSASWSTASNGVISVTCRITHEQGHSEETTLTAPADASGSKNAIQQIGSTVTYLQRYTLMALCGLAAHEMDDDGASAGTELISLAEKNAILDKLIAKDIDEAKFLQFMKIERLEDMKKSDLVKAHSSIDAKVKK